MGQSTKSLNLLSSLLSLTLALVLSGGILVITVDTRIVEAVKCVCDGGCEHLRGEDCPFGLTFDMCRCCLVCARGEGEPCGGALGNCAAGLHCKKDLNDTNEESRCSRDDEGCGKVVEQYGCVIGPEGNCICSSRTGCPDEEMFLFDTEDACRSRMAFLIAKKDLEPATSPVPATDDCAKVQCPEVDPCPIDSYRLPTIVDTNHPVHAGSSSSSSDEDGHFYTSGSSTSSNINIIKGCCPTVQKCQCIPGLHCSPPECPHGSFAKVTINATGEPGRCCPKFQCSISSMSSEHDRSRSVEDGEIGQVFRKCNYSGREYHSGETWSHQQDCTECFCHNGVVSCKPLKCDLPSECRLARTPPQSCCPVCVGCVTSTGVVYNNSEVWDEDPCTTCTCNEGRIQCHAAMCQTSCSNPRHIPGECCPRCDNGPPPEKEQSCPFLDCHRKDCPNGFRLDKSGCPTCKCIKCRNSLSGCNKKCPFGYEIDERQCAVCECRAKEPNNLLLPPTQDEDDKLMMMHITTKDPDSWHINNNKILAGHCQQTSDGRFRFEGEEWADHCRRCICKNGSEMCTLITCSPPNCEHPIFFPGDCCPRCPDEEIGLSSNFNVSICQSSDGTERLEGEMWSLSPCLTCTCHSGQVLCAAPECPPTPCPNSFMKAHQDCCLSCPSHNPEREDSSSSSRSGGSMDRNILFDDRLNAFTNNSSHSKKPICLSDDSAKSYSDGEMWKVGACQSCICDGGRIQCFSAGKCPPLKCDRPVLAKNQCCPICLGQERQVSSIAGGEIMDVPDSKDDPRIGGANNHHKNINRLDSDGGSSISNNNNNSSSNNSGGIEPHCAIMIASLMCITLVLALLVVRQCLCRRSSSRLIKKTPPSFHSSNSSNNQETPPVTPDCCYKCDYNKYSSCAQLSEQKPLFKPSSDSSSQMGNNSDKV